MHEHRHLMDNVAIHLDIVIEEVMLNNRWKRFDKTHQDNEWEKQKDKPQTMDNLTRKQHKSHLDKTMVELQDKHQLFGIELDWRHRHAMDKGLESPLDIELALDNALDVEHI